MRFLSLPFPQMDECIWIGCVDPPEPGGFKVKSDWDGLRVYGFGDTATYTCEGAGLFFEEDRAMESFTVKCLDNGKWEEPSPWPKCTSGKHDLRGLRERGAWVFIFPSGMKPCTYHFEEFIHPFPLADIRCVPPPPAPRAGLREWNGNFSYGTTARFALGFCPVRWWRQILILSQLCFPFVFSYKCGNYARFKDADGNLHDSTTLTCQWNRTWSGDLDECSCANIPLWISSEMS